MKPSAHLRQLMDERDLRYQQRFEANSSAIAAALLAAKEAVTKAEAATEKRFEAMNEFRGALTDQAQLFASRIQVDALRDQLLQALSALSARVDLMEGSKKGGKEAWGFGAGIIGALVGIGGIALALFRV